MLSLFKTFCSKRERFVEIKIMLPYRTSYIYIYVYVKQVSKLFNLCINGFRVSASANISLDICSVRIMRKLWVFVKIFSVFCDLLKKKKKGLRHSSI